MKFEIIRRKDKAKKVADVFKQQYFRQGKWATYQSWSVQPKQAYEKILAAKGNPDKIDEAIGNGNLCWTYERCDQYDQYKPLVLALDKEYESGTIICIECLVFLADMFRS